MNRPTPALFPLERWAERNPRVRWPLVFLLVFALCWLGSF